VNALEPDSNVWDESNARAQLFANLLLVNVIRQAVWDKIVRQVLDIILRARLRAGT